MGLICPNVNSPEFKETQKEVGTNNAYFLHNANNGHPLSKTPSGTESSIFSHLQQKFGKNEAIKLKALGYYSSNGNQEPTLKNIFDAADPAILRDQASVKNQTFIELAVEKIKKAFPDFNVNFVTNEDVEGTRNEGKKGWVKNGQINYNLDKITYDTIVHEAFHLYLYAKSETDPSMVKPLRDEASGLLENENPIAMAVKKANPNLTHDALVDEIIVTIAGLSSRIDLLNVIGHESSVRSVEDVDQYWKDVYGSIVDTVELSKSFYEDAFGFDPQTSAMANLDFQNSKIFQVGQAFAEDFMSGEISLTPMEADIALRTSFKQTSDSRDFRMHPEINTTRDFVGYFKNNSKHIKVLDGLSDDALARHLLGRKTKDNSIFISGNEMKLQSKTSEGMLEEIKEKIIPQIKQIELKDRANVKSFVNDLLAGEDIKEAASTRFSSEKEKTSRYQLKALQQLANSIGAVKGGQAMYYSDLKNSNNPALRDLYDESFEGYDPLIIIHDVKDGQQQRIDISIVDITSMPLGRSGIKLRGHNIFSTVMGDRKAFNKGVDMSNSDGSFRQMTIGMTIMSMKQKMLKKSAQNNKKHDIRFRNIGVINLQKKKIDARMVPDISKLIEHIRILTETSIMNKVKNVDIQNVLADPTLYSSDYDQSFFSILQQYLVQKSNMTGIDKKHLKIMQESSPDQILEVLQERQEFLEATLTEEERQSDKEYLFISGAIMELKFNFRHDTESLRDMKIIGKHITSTHNVRSKILQEIIRQGEKISQRIYDLADKEFAKFKPGFKKYIKAYEATHDPLQKFVADKGSQYFKHLYKRRIVSMNSGDGIVQKEITVPELHWDINDPETKQALSEGIITEEDVAWAKQLVESIEQRFIDNVYHEHKARFGSGKNYTKDDAKEALYQGGYKKGTIPVIKKSVNERLFDGDIKGGLNQFGEQMGQFDNFLEDELGDYNKEMSKVSDRFKIHQNSMQSYEKAGLRYGDDGNLYLDDEEMNTLMSTNLEKIYRYFMLSSIRKEQYEKDFLPYVNNANILMKHLNDKGLKQDGNLEYLEEFVERLVHLQTQDTDERANILGYNVKASRLMNTSIQTVGFMAMGYRPWLGLKSHAFNELQGWMQAFSNGLVSNDYFGPTDYLKAHNLAFTDFKKIKALSKMFHVVDGTEDDLINNPFLIATNKNLGNNQFSNIANYMSDIYARRVVMVAQMLKEGSYHAYDLDEETGELVYDETKDERMYDPHGELTEEGAAIKTFIKSKLVDDGNMAIDEDKLTRGHDYESAHLFKYLSDKYVIGSMDNKSRSMIGNHYLGRAVSQFRLFSIDKFFNFGIDAATRESVFGGTIKTMKDENGNLIARREVIEIEGQLQSLGAAIKAIRNLKNENIAEWWKMQGSVRRTNLAKLVLKLATFGLLYASIKGIADGDQDKERKLAWIYEDLLDWSIAWGTLTNPAPVVNQVDRFFELIFGEKEIQGIESFAPPAVNDITDAVKFIESFEN